ncbi:helix-turn-helix transcriptional regulator [Antrihabitans spumae]|uniref:Helix-turn-helix transcriptional regulator n=1 Tax=Antrihabitans spumae TaxID=3373370 RepID=A0ABW7K7G2_9NOCA
MTEASDDVLVGSNVQKFRTARGMSQADLAEAISRSGEQFHQQTILKIEKGTRPLKYLEAHRICAALRVGLADLLEKEARASADAGILEHTTKLSDLSVDIDELSVRLADQLVALADAVAIAGKDASPYLVTNDGAGPGLGFLRTNWGDELNERLFDALSRHDRVAELPADWGNTSAEVLERIAGQDWDSNGQDDDRPS